MKYCTNCGHQMADHMLYCSKCGTKSEEEQTGAARTSTEGVRGGLYTSYDQLPLSLCADDIAAVLNISRANAYTLMHAKGFPTIHIGKRMVVLKDKFLEWLNEQMETKKHSWFT